MKQKTFKTLSVTSHMPSVLSPKIPPGLSDMTFTPEMILIPFISSYFSRWFVISSNANVSKTLPTVRTKLYCKSAVP